MKSLKRSLAAVTLAAICVTGLVACDSNKAATLAAPQNLEIDDCEYLSWDRVEGASKYSVEINEKVYQTEDNKLDIFLLTDQPIYYNIRVKAEGNSQNVNDSDWSEAIGFDCDDGNPISLTFNLVDKHYEASIQLSLARGKLIIPSEYNGYSVTRLSTDMLYGVGSEFDLSTIGEVRSLIIPDSIYSFNNGSDYITFDNFYNLTRVKLPQSLKKLGYALFSYCEKLTEVIVPDSVEKIEDSVFKNCTNLKKIVLPDSLKYIGYSAFEGCKSLQSLHIPASVEMIDVPVFKNCPNLTVTIDENNKFYAVDGNTIIEKSSGKVISTFGV